MIKLVNILFEQDNRGLIGPVFHGGNWDGIKPINVKGRGALGSGAYFTPIESVAVGYAKESGGKLSQAYLEVRNPLKIYMTSNNRIEHPCVLALVQLGMDRAKAEAKVEKVEEQKGYLGTEISRLAIPQGYDGIFEYFDGTLREIVVWNSRQVKPSK